MEREKLLLTSKEGRAIVYGDTDEYVKVQEEIVGQRRWETDFEIVVKRLSDNKFFKGYYSQGSTESQDSKAFEYSEPDFNEVFEVQKTISVYE